MRILQIIGGLVVVVVIFAAGYFVAEYGVPWHMTQTDTVTTTTDTMESSSTPDTKTSAPAGSVEVDTSSLTDGQRQLLQTLGIDANSVTVTPAMMTCAEAAVGTTRLDEIKAGDTPSFTEGLKLFGCYTKN